ncbi:hypothetical protein C8F01DRAFT_633879 [Mycena amicta]|nr:hypothetical protein C8F01DRAFT_633879 [Mycena amicta]
MSSDAQPSSSAPCAGDEASRVHSPSVQDLADACEAVRRGTLFIHPGSTFPPELVEQHEASGIECAACKQSLSFRDANGHLTLDHWNAHLSTCSPSFSFSPSIVDILATQSQPPRRRRPKRTEEQRIAYLAQDSYVAQFEAFRVLCKGCDRWIRLRPNSTYCSIPWDAHRKSCLQRRRITVDPPATPDSHRAPKRAKYEHDLPPDPVTLQDDDVDGEYEEEDELAGDDGPTYLQRATTVRLADRVAIFTQDPAVQGFNEDGIICAGCRGWIETPQTDHSAALGIWQHHRSICGPVQKQFIGTVPPAPATPASTPQRRPTPRTTHPLNNPDVPIHLPLPGAPDVIVDVSPKQYAPPNETRRRSAEKRRATLEADVLIRVVEPNRVFCAMCEKWVSLRQDSSYCAYPWLQHRGKCLVRYQKKQEAAKTSPARRIGPAPTSPSSPSASASSSPTKAPRHDIPAYPPRKLPAGSYLGPMPPTPTPMTASPFLRDVPNDDAAHASEWVYEKSPPSRDTSSKSHKAKAKAVDTGAGVSVRPDLNSENGRCVSLSLPPFPFLLHFSFPGPVLTFPRHVFVWASIGYLFRTTHESGVDELSISALLMYVNAALPTDKYEDFDTQEVVQAAGMLCGAPGSGFVLVGDAIRPRDASG